jgi:hypothetical protein
MAGYKTNQPVSITIWMPRNLRSFSRRAKAKMSYQQAHAIDALLDSEISEALHGEPDPNEWLVRYASAFKSKHGAWPVLG